MDNLANKQNSNLTLLSQYNNSTSDGSLSDILQVPFQYHHNLESNILPHLLQLENKEPFIQHTHHHQISPHNESAVQITDTLISISHHDFDQDVYMDHTNSIFKEQQLPPPILSLNYDAHNMVPPPLPPLNPLPASSQRPPLRKGTPSYREAHIQSERQRRQDMTRSFNRLRSLLPSMQDNDLQGDRCTILGHVIKYVQELDKKVQELGKRKAQLMLEEEKAIVVEEQQEEDPKEAGDGCTTNVSVRSWGNLDIFITLNCPKQPGLWPNLLALLQDTLQLDVQNVALSSTPLFSIHSIYAKVTGKAENEGVSCEMLQEMLGNFVADHAHKNIVH